MKKCHYLIMLSLFLLASCSKDGGGSSSLSPNSISNLSKSKLMKSELDSDLSALRSGNYAISNSELQALRDENLLSDEEESALKITK